MQLKGKEVGISNGVTSQTIVNGNTSQTIVNGNTSQTIVNGNTSQTICDGNTSQTPYELQISTQVTEKQPIISGETCHRKTICNGDKSQPSPECRNLVQEMGTQTENQSECMNLIDGKLTENEISTTELLNSDSTSSGSTTGWRAVPSEDNQSNISNGNGTGKTCVKTTNYAGILNEKDSELIQENRSNYKSINDQVSDECCTKYVQRNNSEGCNRSTRSLSYADAIKSSKNSDIITSRRCQEYESSGKVLASNGTGEGSFVNGRSQTSRSHDNSNSCSEPGFPKKPSKLPPGKVNGNIVERESTKSVPKKFGYQIPPRLESHRNNSSKRNFNKKPKKNFVTTSESVVEPLDDSAEVSSNNCTKQSKDVVSNGNLDKQVDPKCHGAIPKVRNSTKNRRKQKNHLADANKSQDFKTNETTLVNILKLVENSMPQINELMESFQDNNSKEKSDSQTLKNGMTETIVPSTDNFIDTAVEHVNSCQQEEFTGLNASYTTANDEVDSTSCEQTDNNRKFVIGSENNVVNREVNTSCMHVFPSPLEFYPKNNYGYIPLYDACSIYYTSANSTNGYGLNYSKGGITSNFVPASVNGACGYEPNYSRIGTYSFVPDSANGACGYEPNYSRIGTYSFVPDSANGACGYEPNYSRIGTYSFVPDSANGACGYDPDYFDREDSSVNRLSQANDTTKVSKNSRLNPLAQEYIPTSMENHCNNSVVSNLADLCDEVPQQSETNSNLLSNQTDSQSQPSNQVESDAPLQSSSQAGVDSLPVEDDLEEFVCYMFLLHTNLCGILIGKNAKFLTYIYSQATVYINVTRGNPNSDMNVVTVAGKDSQVQIALEIIKKKFKNVRGASFEQINAPSPVQFSSERLKINLSVHVDFDVVLTSTVLPNHFFIHLPTMSSYHELPSMYNAMSFHYNHERAPIVVKLEVGNIVAAPFNNFGSILWLRAEVTTILPDDKCEVKFLDMGGYGDYKRRDLRKMHRAFMEFPFQAIECFLADVNTPENGWSEESIVIFQSLTQNQVLKAVVAYHADDGTPYLLLYRFEPSRVILINQFLVDLGFTARST